MGNKQAAAEKNENECTMCGVIPLSTQKITNSQENVDDSILQIVSNPNRPLDRPNKTLASLDISVCQQFHNNHGKTIAMIIPTTPSSFIPNLPVISSDFTPLKLDKGKSSSSKLKNAKDIVDKTCSVGQILNAETGQCEAIVALTQSGMPLLDVPSRPAAPLLIKTQKKIVRQNKGRKKTQKKEGDITDTWISQVD